jgi:hypothetical protein
MIGGVMVKDPINHWRLANTAVLVLGQPLKQEE